jgi:hypothetical protein
MRSKARQRHCHIQSFFCKLNTPSTQQNLVTDNAASEAPTEKVWLIKSRLKISTSHIGTVSGMYCMILTWHSCVKSALKTEDLKQPLTTGVFISCPDWYHHTSFQEPVTRMTEIIAMTLNQ